MPEPTVQVPESLLRRTIDTLSSQQADPRLVRDELRALFSQPTPSAEPVAAWRDRQGDVWTEGDDGLMHTRETAPFPREHVEKKWGPLVAVAAPPSIADMAPGTTFTAEVRFLVDSHGTALPHSGFNPSTIRDVVATT